jgi:hypothetical protein
MTMITTEIKSQKPAIKPHNAWYINAISQSVYYFINDTQAYRLSSPCHLESNIISLQNDRWLPVEEIKVIA